MFFFFFNIHNWAVQTSEASITLSYCCLLELNHPANRGQMPFSIETF